MSWLKSNGGDLGRGFSKCLFPGPHATGRCEIAEVLQRRSQGIQLEEGAQSRRAASTAEMPDGVDILVVVVRCYEHLFC
jgi:hypothetical protein